MSRNVYKCSLSSFSPWLWGPSEEQQYWCGTASVLSQNLMIQKFKVWIQCLTSCQQPPAKQESNSISHNGLGAPKTDRRKKCFCRLHNPTAEHIAAKWVKELGKDQTNPKSTGTSVWNQQDSPQTTRTLGCEAERGGVLGKHLYIMLHLVPLHNSVISRFLYSCVCCWLISETALREPLVWASKDQAGILPFNNLSGAPLKT